MTSLHGHPKNGKSSIKYRWVSLDLQSYEPNTNFPQKDAHIACENGKVESQTKFPTVSAAKFLSANGRVWKYAGNLEDFQNGEGFKIHHDDSPRIGSYKAELIVAPARINSCKSENSILDGLKDVTNDRFIETAEKTPVEASTSEANWHHVAPKGYDSCDKSNNLLEKTLQVPGSFYSAYSFLPMTGRKGSIVGFSSHGSSLYFSYNFDFLTSTDCIYEQCPPCARVTCSSAAEISEELSISNDNNTRDNDKNLSQELLHGQQYSSNYCFSAQDKLHNVLVKNRHAIAGALAGTMVSLCLHPMDTIKTIIQADAISQKSACSTLRTIISGKGISGLYRGAAIKIASSAPISAIYTLTYESVKGGLLPILPEEYRSIAHCIAGGCASIATSVVFTPSERIKQQMQVGLQYQNCWNALIGCLEKGGLPSLYAGWRAVLCRNIPHSIVKFYTYESLKQLLLTSAKPDESLNTLQTLLCGGIAGSTAAFCTTPFDVIKTRLQTQAPGTLGKYNGVFHALQEIVREEGLQGLYRGLIPRLVMYISQGAIFFASYEFLKEVLAMEAPHSPVQPIHDKPNAESGSTS